MHGLFRLVVMVVACVATGWVAASAAGQARGVYQAPYPEPTPEETLILEFINRARANPAADGRRILESGARIPGKVDRAMFEREMAEVRPAPPLVFNLQLLDAARKHSHYMILNEQGHDQIEGRPGFTGKSMSDRIRGAGYRGNTMAENAFLTASDPWYSHVGFQVDWGPPDGDGGMQPGRGHRRNIHNPGFREIGPAAVPHGRMFSVVHNFGGRNARFLGGVAYFDRNGNGFYDIGEGRGGVTISAAGKSTQTWDSGAYVLEIPNNQPVMVTAEYDGLRFTHRYEASADNIKFDFIIPAGHDIEKARRLIAAVEAIDVDAKRPTTADARRRAELRLHFGIQGLFLDDATREQAQALTAEVIASMRKLEAQIVELINGDDVVLARRAVFEARADYRGTPFDDWLGDAFACAELLNRQRQLRGSDGQRTPTAPAVRSMIAELERRRSGLKTEFWRGWLDELIEQTRSAA